MTIKEMREIKKEMGYTYAQISEWSGVPLGTVQKVFTGETESPRYSTLQALQAVFEREQVHHRVEEPGVYYGGRSGEHNVTDYYALPEDVRMELIDGVFYDMASPSFLHQRIAGEIYRQIANYISQQKGSCIPLIAPMDVRLDCDDRTMVQPDVMIVCDRNKIKNWGIMGAPDFILEVLSPSTKRKDCIKKLDKYMEAGVREYWMIDPQQQKVIIYQFEEEIYPVIYGLEEAQPVGIFEDRFKMDLSVIRSMLSEEG